MKEAGQHRVICSQLQLEAELRSSYSKEAQQALDLATHQWQSSMMTPKYLAAAAATAMDEKYREPTRRASTSDLVCRGPMAMHSSLQNGTSSRPGHLKTQPSVQRQRRGSAKTWTATWSSEVVNTNRVKPSSAAWGYVKRPMGQNAIPGLQSHRKRTYGWTKHEQAQHFNKRTLAN